ncbi:glycosyltransferase family 4 protein [Fibrella forsythiae]|uniref:Glycosyltransferase family 4 protein n=1 Tax=Fibrella forsythiae TaxID=2817061 RepID=A0ABS3JI96_9BACT|nr:glycosyltransferase family 4 protein [Fibrella forsythiae]MBO0949722.1 glycosyltransferase family 4 protein [Fibrella forsythiae]
MLNVLLSAYACLPNRGSEEGNGWHYSTLLSQRGLRVHCITREEFRSAIEPELAKGEFPNLTVHYVGVPDWLDRAYGNLVGLYAHYVYWQWQAAKLAKKLDQQYDFDLVHHVTYSSLQLGSFMYRVGKPFVFGPAGGGQRVPKVMKHYLGSYYSREVLRDGVSWLLQHFNPGFYRTMRQADQVLISNSDSLELARNYRGSKPTELMLDSGIGADFQASVPQERVANPPVLNLLWVGRLLPRKALELTIHAFSRVNPALPIRLTIVGGQGEMADQVPTYLTKYNVADRVNWVGHVSYDEVLKYYQQSDIFLFTSLRDSGPTQVTEAMANSMPVITLALHGQAEMVNGTNGIKVSVISNEQVLNDLAAAIERLYHNPAERLEMGRKAYSFAKNQVWDEKINAFTDRIYPSLVRQKKLVSAEQ